MGSILEYNGGTTVAMKGHNCVAIASDKRFGVEMSTISNSVSKLFEYGNNIILGMSGLSTDISSLYIEHDLKHFRSRVFDNKFKLFKLQRNSMMTTYQFMNFVSSTLYSRRFSPYFVEPVLCGIDHDGESRIASTDLIGCINYADDFVVSGTASNSLYGICESYFEPNLDEDALFEAISRSLISACDRDAYSGGGAIVKLISTSNIYTYDLNTRKD